MPYWLTAAQDDYYWADEPRSETDIEVTERPAEGYRWDAQAHDWFLPDLWVYGSWLTAEGAYYEGNQAAPGDRAVPRRPSAEHDWDSTAWVANLDMAVKRRCAEVDLLRDQHFAEGVPYLGKVLQLGDVDQQRIIAAGATAKFALIAAAQSGTPPTWPPQGFGWIMADNSVLVLDAAGVSAMADAAASQVSAWIFNGYAHKKAIRALNDAAAVDAHDITTGW